jgi:hypothetical protein
VGQAIKELAFKDKTPECPNCKAKLETITPTIVESSHKLAFSKTLGKYVPHYVVFNAEEFRCPACGFALPDKWINEKTDKNLVSISVAGIHKTLVVDKRDLPYNVQLAEAFDKLPKAIKIAEKKETEEKGQASE